MDFKALALANFSVALLAAGGAMAQDHRELGAHEHGTGQLGIALEGDRIAMELHVPGADIAGFEHAATSDADKATIAAAIEALEQPLTLFVLPEAAGCTVAHAHAALEAEAHHDEDHADDEGHDHDADHAHDEEHDHDDDHAHDEDHGEDHADDEGRDHDADHAHDEEHDHDADHADEDHAHEDHADEDHPDEGHDHDHEEGGHSEFHAEYELVCADITAADRIEFAYFGVFPNAQELDVQLVTDTGALSAEITRDRPALPLGGRL